VGKGIAEKDSQVEQHVPVQCFAALQRHMLTIDLRSGKSSAKSSGKNGEFPFSLMCLLYAGH
jgi:hypothetical protein